MNLSPVAYAYGAGLLAAFNPCGFVLLPTYAAAFIAESPQGGPRAALGVSAKLLAGFILVFTVLGSMIGVIGSSVSTLGEFASWLGVATGALLVAAGVVLLAGRKLPGVRLQLSSGRGALSYGIGYAAASLACALPVFLSAVVYSFQRNGIFAGVLSGGAYAAGMGTVVTAVVLLSATARQGAIRRMKGVMRAFNPIAGVLLICAGAVLLLRRWADISFLEDLSARTVDAVDNARWIPPLIVVALLAALLLPRLRRRHGDTDATETKTNTSHEQHQKGTKQ